MNKQNEPVLDHEYDGIKELDHPLPRWWLITFYLSMVFAVLYIAHYHFGSGKSLEEELAADMAKIEEQKKLSASLEPQALSEETLLAVFKDPAQREMGHKVFTEKCASCHGGSGEGGIGPNLTDRYWLHGNGSLSAIAKVVGDGVPDKGMPSWRALLKDNEYQTVVAFVRSLKDSKPANGKAPQGIEAKE